MHFHNALVWRQRIQDDLPLHGGLLKPTLPKQRRQLGALEAQLIPALTPLPEAGVQIDVQAAGALLVAGPAASHAWAPVISMLPLLGVSSLVLRNIRLVSWQ